MTRAGNSSSPLITRDSAPDNSQLRRVYNYALRLPITCRDEKCNGCRLSLGNKLDVYLLMNVHKKQREIRNQTHRFSLGNKLSPNSGVLYTRSPRHVNNSTASRRIATKKREFRPNPLAQARTPWPTILNPRKWFQQRLPFCTTAHLDP